MMRSTTYTMSEEWSIHQITLIVLRPITRRSSLGLRLKKSSLVHFAVVVALRYRVSLS